MQDHTESKIDSSDSEAESEVIVPLAGLNTESSTVFNVATCQNPGIYKIISDACPNINLGYFLVTNVAVMSVCGIQLIYYPQTRARMQITNQMHTG